MRLNPFEGQGYAFVGNPFLWYDTMVHSLSDDIEWRAEIEIGDYQGDILFYGESKTSEKVYFVSVGYGSCSGCDDFLDADYREDRDARMEEIRDGIKRRLIEFDSKEEFENYMNNSGWQQWWWRVDLEKVRDTFANIGITIKIEEE